MMGDRLLLLARAWFDEATVVRVFEPLIADWQRECADINGATRLWCRARGYSSFASTMLLMLPAQIVRPLPTSISRSGYFAMESFAALTAIALLPIYFREYAFSPGWPYLIPTVLAHAAPLALIPTIIVLSRVRGAQAHHERSERSYFRFGL